MTALLEELLNTERATFTLIHPEKDTVATGGRRTTTGLVEQDIDFDMKSVFNDTDSSGNTHAFQQGMQGVEQAFGGAQGVRRSIQQTFSQWDGSQRPIFVIPMTLVKYKENYDILDIVKHLFAGVAPTYTFGVLGGVLHAPYGYTARSLFGELAHLGLSEADWVRGNAVNSPFTYSSAIKNIRGTWAIRYSSWFYANFLVLHRVSASFSKETVKGTTSPLYAKVQLQFSPAALPDQDMVKSWFLKDILVSKSSTSAL